MEFFSSDRCIEDYAKQIWNLTKVDKEEPVIEKVKRKISHISLKESSLK